MGLNIATWFRQQARGLSLLLLLAFLLPVAAGLLPQAALGAEAQLARDLSISLCSPSDSEPGLPAVDRSSHDCCILCATGLVPVSVPDEALDLAVALRRAATGVVFAASLPAPRGSLIYDSDLTLRGPPSLI